MSIENEIKKLNSNIEAQNNFFKTFQQRSLTEEGYYGKNGIQNAKRIDSHYSALGFNGTNATTNIDYLGVNYNEPNSFSQKIKCVVSLTGHQADGMPAYSTPPLGGMVPVLLTQNLNGNERSIADIPLNFGGQDINSLISSYENLTITPLSNFKHFYEVNIDDGSRYSTLVGECEIDNDINFNKTLNRVVIFNNIGEVLGELNVIWPEMIGLYDASYQGMIQISTTTYGR